MVIMPHPYGYQHRKRRIELMVQAIAEGSPCPKCGAVILDPDGPGGEPLDLGHVTQQDKVLGLLGRQIEHRRCNRSHDRVRPDARCSLSARWPPPNPNRDQGIGRSNATSRNI